MKKSIKKSLIYLTVFILLFIIGIAISDIIIIARAKYLLHIAESLNFEKDISKAYPTLTAEQNGLTELQKIYDALEKLPDALKELDRKININADATVTPDELKKFWDSPEVIKVANGLSSIPYTTRFDMGFSNEQNKIHQNLKMLIRLHNFYVNYLKFCASQGDKLQVLIVFQKLITVNRALERQNLAVCEHQRQLLWISALDTLVRHGPTEKRYLEYYQALQKLVQSLDFEYCPELTIKYNDLKHTLAAPVTGDNIFEKRNNYITSVKQFTKEFRTALLHYPLPADLKRTPSLPKDIFEKQKNITKSQLQILMHLKMYQIQNNFFPEAIEGFPELPFSGELIYKRISPNDFVLKQINPLQ